MMPKYLIIIINKWMYTPELMTIHDVCDLQDWFPNTNIMALDEWDW